MHWRAGRPHQIRAFSADQRAAREPVSVVEQEVVCSPGGSDLLDVVGRHKPARLTWIPGNPIEDDDQ
jgi:hypothetical protein